MLANELKCIEVLMRTLSGDTSLDAQILSVFDDPKDYRNHKNNLFNLISIKNLVTYYHENLPFSLQNFLNTGIIPGLFDEKCVVPTIYESSTEDIEETYGNIVEALSKDHYVFDDENNIYISSESIEASIPQVWLHRLAQGSKRTTVEKTYLFNKSSKQIKNKEDLIDYLRRTKSFVVRMSSSNPNINYDKEFNNIKRQVDSFLRGQKEVRVEHIIDLVHRLASSDINIETHRHKLADNYWLIKIAEKMGDKFYKEPLEVQESLIDKWIVEHINSSELSDLEAQKFILQADKRVNINTLHNINTNEALSGLFSLYMNIISSDNINLDTISLSDFRIKKYLPESKQVLKSTRNAYSTAISAKKVTIDELRRKADELLSDIARLDLIKDFAIISEKREEYNELLERYNKEQRTSSELTEKREELTEYESTLPNNYIETIAFDNDKLISLINRATIKGRIYISGKDLVIEDYNPEFSEPVFKVMININKLLDLIENINFTLDEFGTTTFDSSNDLFERTYDYRKVS